MDTAAATIGGHLALPMAAGETTGNRLLAALHALRQRCCPDVSVKPWAPSDKERCGLHLPTALTLLCLLGGMAQRVEGVLPAGAAGDAFPR